MEWRDNDIYEWSFVLAAMYVFLSNTNYCVLRCHTLTAQHKHQGARRENREDFFCANMLLLRCCFFCVWWHHVECQCRDVVITSRKRQYWIYRQFSILYIREMNSYRMIESLRVLKKRRRSIHRSVDLSGHRWCRSYLGSSKSYFSYFIRCST